MRRGAASVAAILGLVVPWVAGASVTRAQEEPPSAPSELIVRFRPKVSKGQVANFYREHGLAQDEDLDSDPSDDDEEEKLVRARGPVTDGLIERLERDPKVAFAERNYLLSADSTTPIDPLFSDLWGQHNVGQTIRGTTGTSDADVDALEAWDRTSGSANVLVGVIDTGIDYNHPDLAANVWTNPGEVPENGVDDDTNGYVDDVHGISAITDLGDPMDDHGHGTHTSGTVGAVGNNGIGVAGVAWNVRIVSCKFLNSQGSGTTADAIECFKYLNRLKRVAGQNIVATNNSWGGGGFSQALKDAMAGAEQPGMPAILHAAAAGNGNLNNDSTAHYPDGYDLPHIISVAATDNRDLYASFTNYGRTKVDLAAPGVDICSTWRGASSKPCGPTAGYHFGSGTSMATPHVAGAAALVWSVSPGSTAAQAKEILLSTVDPIGNVGNNSSKPTVTNGRLNVARALGSLAPPDPTPPAAPVGLTITDPRIGSALDVAWTSNTEPDLAGYHLYRTTDPPASSSRVWTRTNDVLISSAGLRDGGLSDGSTYYYTVTAADGSDNESARSAEASGIPSDTTAPAVPSGLTIAAADSRVVLDWADNADADLAGYRVYRRNPDGTWPGNPFATTTASAFTDTGLTNGIAYTYRVSAFDASGHESGPSNEASGTPAPVALVKRYTPAGYTIVMGSVDGSRGGLSRLYENDGSRLEISASTTISEFYAWAFIQERATLRKLTVDYDGNASRSDAGVYLRIWNWTTGRWVSLDGPRYGTSDRALTWSESIAPTNYVSETGEIRFDVMATRGGSFKTRTDLVRFTIEY